MKKVLFIVTKSENGGAQTWVKEQIEILQGLHDVYLVTDEEGWLVQNTQVKKYFTNIKIRKKFSLSFLIQFSNFLKENNIDLIVASSANAGIYSRLSKLLYRTKIIYVGHGWSSVYNGGKLKKLYMGIENFLSKYTESILCVSAADYNRARDEIGIDEKKLKVIRSKIMPMEKKSERQNNEKLKILSVARFRLPKRNDLLIQSMKNIDADLYLVGDGPLRKNLEKQNNNKNIHFLGEIDGFNEFYKYDIFVLISDSEALGLSAVEAMSAGLPLVLSNVGGCPELIDNNGVLVENNADSITDGIKKAIKQRRDFSNKSLELFENEFDLIKNKYIYIDYYHSILN